MIRSTGAAIISRTGPGYTPSSHHQQDERGEREPLAAVHVAERGQKRRIQSDGTVKKTRWNIHSM